MSKFLAEVTIDAKRKEDIVHTGFVVEGNSLFELISDTSKRLKERLNDIKINNFHGIKIVLRKG